MLSHRTPLKAHSVFASPVYPFEAKSEVSGLPYPCSASTVETFTCSPQSTWQPILGVIGEIESHFEHGSLKLYVFLYKLLSMFGTSLLGERHQTDPRDLTLSLLQLCMSASEGVSDR
jgi:hypothetical protein